MRKVPHNHPVYISYTPDGVCGKTSYDSENNLIVIWSDGIIDRPGESRWGVFFNFPNREDKEHSMVEISEEEYMVRVVLES